MGSLTGMQSLLSDISRQKVNLVVAKADEAIGELTKSTADEMSARAPVETGLLKATIRSGVAHKASLHWDIEADLETVPYYWRQNFEHKTNRYYITDPALKAQHRLVTVLQAVVDTAW